MDKTPSCFICSIKIEPGEGNSSEFSLHSVFWKFVKDFLQIGKTESTFCDTEPERLCDCCSKTVDSISHLYLELLGTQLQISWKLHELAKLLQCSKWGHLQNFDGQGPSNAYQDDDNPKKHEFKKELYIICSQKGTARQVLEVERVPSSDRGVNVEDKEEIKEELESAHGDNDLDPGECSDQCDDDDDDREHSRKARRVGSKRNQMKDVPENPQKEQHTCQHCGKTYFNSLSLLTHLRANHKPISCSFCEETLIGNIAHYDHLFKSHLEECGKECPTCGKVFATKSRLNVHSRKAHSSRRFPCPVCKISVKCERYLKEHIAAVHNPTPNICPHCGKTFGSARYLVAHISERHAEFAQVSISNQKRHQCPTCQEWFHRRVPFERHVLLECNPTKAGEILRECKICGKPMGIYDAPKMERHLFTHMNAEEKKGSEIKFPPKKIELHLCATCGREFKSKTGYAAHCSAHRGEKGKFVCDQCPRAFHLRSGLKSHILTVHLKPKAALSRRRKKQGTITKTGSTRE